MKAREAINPILIGETGRPAATVGCDMPLLDVLPRFLETADGRLGVEEEERLVGIIDERSLLDALGRQIPARLDCSVIELECAPGDYSASAIARAVEDADVHLVDLLTQPGAEGKLNVTLRVRCDDPQGAIHSLERYGYTVTDSYSHSTTHPIVSMERLLELQALINV